MLPCGDEDRCAAAWLRQGLDGRCGFMCWKALYSRPRPARSEPLLQCRWGGVAARGGITVSTGGFYSTTGGGRTVEAARTPGRQAGPRRSGPHSSESSARRHRPRRAPRAGSFARFARASLCMPVGMRGPERMRFAPEAARHGDSDWLFGRILSLSAGPRTSPCP